MPSNSDLSFHVPSAGLRSMESAAAPGAGAFAHLHLVGNPDWMSSFSANQQVAAARPVLAPPAPVAAEPLAVSAPAAIDAPAAAAAPAKKGGFLSMFYRAPSSAAVALAPPRALDAFDTPPQRALPVDAQLSLEHFSHLNTAAEARVAPTPPRREPPRPMALGSDTWNALSGVPLPPKAVAAVGASPASSTSAAARLLAPPASIDGVTSRAPKPLWSDLSFASRFRSTAPTLEAFRNAPPAPILSTPPDSPVLQRVAASPAPVTAAAAHAVPVPPKPLTTSPLRDAAVANSLEAAAAPQTRRDPPRAAAAHPLVPVGEDARAAVTPLLRPVAEAPAALAATTAAAAATRPAPAATAARSTSPTWSTEPPGLAHGDMEALWLPTASEAPASPLPSAEFARSVAEPVTRQAQREEARAAANARNFISTLFSRRGDDDGGDSPASSSAKADGFNALEMVTNRRSTQAKASQPVDYSTFFSSSLFDDDCDEDSEEGLEKLRRVVSIVMQAAKSHDGTSSGSQPPSQSSRRGGSGSGVGGGGSGGNGSATMPAASPFTSRYTEFSASYQTSHTGNGSNSAAFQNDWSNLARF